MTEPADARTEVRDLLRAGERALLQEGDLAAGRTRYRAAYQAAERLGEPLAMARAALGYSGLWVHEHRGAAAAAAQQAYLRRALAQVNPASLIGLRLRVRLAGEADYRSGRHDRVLAVLDEARTAGDPVTLAMALRIAHHCVLGPDHGALRRSLDDEMLAVADLTHRRVDLLFALVCHTADLFLAGDPHARRSLGELTALLAQRDHLAARFVTTAMEAMLAVRAGQFSRAEQAAAECARRGELAGDADADGWRGAHTVAVHWFQGRIGELRPLLESLVHAPSLSAVDNSYVGVLAVASASLGDVRRAQGALARLGGRNLASLPRSSSWLVTLYAMVEAGYLLRDPEPAASVYPLLAPYADLPMMASHAVACFGSVCHALGVAALTMGRAAVAVDHLRTALRRNLALEHWPAAVLSRLRLAEALLRRDEPGDVEAARQELAIAHREAGSLRMALPRTVAPLALPSGFPVGLGAAAVPVPAVLVSAGPGPAIPAPFGLVATVAEVPVFRRYGRQWRIDLGRHRTVVRHSVGMFYLASLVANPGQEIPAVDLAAVPGLVAIAPGLAGEAGVVRGAGAAGRIGAAGYDSEQLLLDPVARRAYRHRLSRLATQIEECSDGEPGSAALRAERDWLAGQLASATATFGRPRAFGGNAERARIAVGKAIRRTLDYIAQADPLIGAQLRAAISTGTRCCYRPAPANSCLDPSTAGLDPSTAGGPHAPEASPQT